MRSAVKSDISVSNGSTTSDIHLGVRYGKLFTVFVEIFLFLLPENSDNAYFILKRRYTNVLLRTDVMNINPEVSISEYKHNYEYQ